MGLAEQDLGRPIPQRHNLVGVGPDGEADGTGQAKVGQLEVALLIDKQVLRLQVAMEDAAGMAVCQATDQLV